MHTINTELKWLHIILDVSNFCIIIQSAFIHYLHTVACCCLCSCCVVLSLCYADDVIHNGGPHLAGTDFGNKFKYILSGNLARFFILLTVISEID